MDILQALEWLNKYNGALIVLLTLVLLGLNVASAFIAFGAFRENRLLRKAGSEPEVVAYFLPDDRYANVIKLIIANVGMGAALKLKFNYDADKEDLANHKSNMLKIKTFNGLSILPQGERLSTFFGMGYDLLAGTPLQPFTFTISYENIYGQKRESSYRLDVSELEGLGRVGESANHEMAKALTKIAREVEGWSGFRRLKIETITSRELAEENRRAIEEMQRRSEQRKPEDEGNA